MHPLTWRQREGEGGNVMTVFLRGAREVGPLQTRDSQPTGKMFSAVKKSTAEHMGHCSSLEKTQPGFCKGKLCSSIVTLSRE